MGVEQQPELKGTCFVVMGFGKKTDFETGRTLDLDKTYRNIIKPAVVDAGLACTRADEIPHSGVIDVPMYERLLTADVVVADLSTSNKNAFYELGVRHALRPHTTIVMCEDGAKSFPFDVNHVLVRQYHHMGEGIDFDEVERFRAALTGAIRGILSKNPPPNDSPVYTFLNGLTPPALAAAMQGVAVAVAKTAPIVDAAAQTGDLIYSELMQQVDEAQADGDFLTAKALLSQLRKKMKEAAARAAVDARQKGQNDVTERPEDPYIIQRLALVTYKSKTPSPQRALEDARDLLSALNPSTSNDTETLGLWGAVHKRLWELTGDRAHLDEAVRGYERGFYLRNDYYNGINFAYLLNVCASDSLKQADRAQSDADATQLRADAVACFVDALKVRDEVLKICETVLDTEKLSNDERYWILATLAEAHLGLGREKQATDTLTEAAAVASAPWMRQSTSEQLDKLRVLLADSPLRFIHPS
ncbi:MAG: DUF4071 domain-containing protein [Blastocatellia bacterium]|nr:MAG: DUF4071 domain-containing protein [Blastocatellia bacterium]